MPHDDQRPTLRVERPWVLALTALLLLFAVLNPSKLLFYLFWVMLALSIGAYVWTRIATRGLNIRREARTDRAVVGGLVDEQFELTNQSTFLPLWVEIQDHSTVPGYNASRVEDLRRGERKRWTARAVCQRRGLYRLGPLSLVAGDPFGIFSVTEVYDYTRTFLVYPEILEVRGFDLPAGQQPGSSRSSARSLQPTTNAASIRGYHPGDPLSRIHWPSTVRTSKLQVKEFDLEPSGDLWIVLDLHAGSQLGIGEDSTEEYCVRLAASLVNRVLSENRAVGLVAYGETPEIVVPARGSKHLRELMEKLAIATAGGSFPIGNVLTEVADRLGRGMTVVVITPSNDPTWLPGLLALGRHGLGLGAIVLDRPSFGGEGDAVRIAGTLVGMGVACQLVHKGDRFFSLTLQAREAEHSREMAEEDEQVVLGTGRVITRKHTKAS